MTDHAVGSSLLSAISCQVYTEQFVADLDNRDSTCSPRQPSARATLAIPNIAKNTPSQLTNSSHCLSPLAPDKPALSSHLDGMFERIFTQLGPWMTCKGLPKLAQKKPGDLFLQLKLSKGPMSPRKGEQRKWSDTQQQRLVRMIWKASWWCLPCLLIAEAPARASIGVHQKVVNHLGPFVAQTP